MSKRTKRKKHRRIKPRPIIMIDLDRISYYGFWVGFVSMVADIGILIYLIWAHGQ